LDNKVFVTIDARCIHEKFWEAKVGNRLPQNKIKLRTLTMKLPVL